MGWLYSSAHPYAVSGTAQNRADGTAHRGRLLVDGDELVFEGNDARVTLPLTGLKFTRNRFSGGPIQLTHRAEPDWVLKTRHTTLFSDPAFDQSETLFAAKRRLHLNWYRLRRLAKLLLALLLVSFIAFPAFRSKSTAAALRYVPASKEIELGDRIFASVAAKSRLIDDPESIAALNAVAQRVTDALPKAKRNYPLRFHLIDDASVNAFAIPGGHIVVHSGLIQQSQSAEELAGVLAHEVGHVVHRHSFTKMAEILGTYALVSIVLGDTETLPSLATGLAAQSYSRDAESDADATALRLLEDARVDPRGLIAFFERQARDYKRHVGGEMDLYLRMSSTHPHPADRARALKEAARTFALGFNPQPIPVDFAALKKRVGERTAQSNAAANQNRR